MFGAWYTPRYVGSWECVWGVIVTPCLQVYTQDRTCTCIITEVDVLHIVYTHTQKITLSRSLTLIHRYWSQLSVCVYSITFRLQCLDKCKWANLWSSLAWRNWAHRYVEEAIFTSGKHNTQPLFALLWARKSNIWSSLLLCVFTVTKPELERTQKECSVNFSQSSPFCFTLSLSDSKGDQRFQNGKGGFSIKCVQTHIYLDCLIFWAQSPLTDFAGTKWVLIFKDFNLLFCLLVTRRGGGGHGGY